MIYGANSVRVRVTSSHAAQRLGLLALSVLGCLALASQGRGDFDCPRNSYSRTLC